MDGFGAALTNSSAYLIHRSSRRDEILRDLFTDDGIGISYVRLPMGASDFTSQPGYTYDDLPEGEVDPQMQRFSIAPDKPFILPVARDALELNPSLRFMASPWSAPAWMKAPRTLNGGSLATQHYDAFALYFVRFVQAYEDEGVPIDAVTPQNEPRHTTDTYPTMAMSPEGQARFVGQHLGPAFEANDIDARILIWDHNWDMADFPLTVLADETARSFTDGVAWHCYGGDVSAQSQVHEAYPEIGTYFTECSGGEWDSDFASVLTWNARNLFIGGVRNWAKTVLLWNLALDENNGPHIGGCDTCRGVMTLHSDGSVVREPEYYSIGHFSKFVTPGARRIESTSIAGTLETVAFENPDGSKVLVALNPGSSPANIDVQAGDETFRYASIPPRSLLTLRWE
ncbi:MAG TPA: glycoside hydrolase family 30 beta sandwich domain-containing protein [Rhodothermales bacterium]